MGSYQLKGPTDSESQSIRTDNGCNSRQPGCERGPTSGAAAGHASEWDPSTLARRADAVAKAWELGCTRSDEAVRRATGLDDLPKLTAAFKRGLGQVVIAIAAATAIGGIAGAAVGATLGGASAVPGAFAGMKLGFDVGMTAMVWLGLGMLAVDVARGLGEVTVLVHRGVVTAWDGADDPRREEAIDAAGQCFADAIGRLVLLVLIAVVARLTASAGSAAGEVVATLRRSRLGVEFASWVEANSARLTRNPRLRAHREVDGSSGGGSGATTPSQLRSNTAKSTTGATDEAPLGKSPASEAPSEQSLAFTKPTLAGITPTRVLAGSNNKLAVIGQSMEGRVKAYARELEAKGYEVEIFDGSTVPKSAADEWALLTSDGKVRLTEAEAMKTKMFEADAAWAAKLKEQGYTIIDIGSNPSSTSASPFYEVEKRIIFGD